MSSLLASGHVLIGAQVGPALAGLAKVDAAFARSGNSMTRSGAVISKAVGLPIAAAFAYSIKAAADFESSLNQMQAVSGATAKQMAQVSATAKQLGNDAKLPATSAKDAADAMTELAKGGFTASQAMKAARGTIMLAAAAGVENAEAATIQADALHAFELKAGDAMRVADLLAASANASTSEIGDMALALKASASVAHQANVPIEDTVAALSNLANAGIKGSDAGTSLKTMLLRLMAPMGAGAKAIKELGLNFRDAEGNMKTIPAIATELNGKLAGLSKAQRDAAMAAIFGSDAIRAANIILGKGAAAHQKMRDEVTKQGAAQALAESKMKGFNGALEKFKSAAETAAISVGEALLPMATQVVKKATELADAFTRLTPEQQKFAMQAAAAAAALGPLLSIMGRFQMAAGSMPASLGKVAGPAGLAVGALALLAATNEDARESMTRLASAAAPVAQALGQLVMNPVVLSMTAGVAAALALYKALTMLRAGMLALTAAAAANPMGVFLVAAAGAAAAIQGLTSMFGGGASAAQRYADATNAAKNALIGFRAAATGAESADLALAQARLQVKAANVDLARTQQQVADGTLKGKDAAIALEGAELRVKQAKLGVKQAADAATQANTKERAELVAHTRAKYEAVKAAQDEVTQAKAAIQVYGASKERIEDLRTAQEHLKTATGNATKQNQAYTAGLGAAGRQAEDARNKTIALQGKMDSLKSKALSITVDNTQAIVAIAGVIAQMALVASKTITLTVKTNHVKGSWNDQETIENLRKEPKTRTLTVNFKSMGTGSVENALKLTKNVIDAIRAAKGNATDLAGGLSGMIGSGVDALANARIAGLGDSPEAQRLRDIIFEQKSIAKAREKGALDTALQMAETEEDRVKAQADLDDWYRDQERQHLEDVLNDRTQAIQDEAEDRKKSADQGIRDLTRMFNEGKISAADYNAQVQKLIGESVGDYRNLGGLLGYDFVQGFGGQLAALVQQINNIAGVGGSGGVGVGPDVQNPGAVANTEQRQRLAEALMTARDKLETAQGILTKRQKDLADAKADAVKASSPGGAGVTSAEAQRISAAQAAVADQQKIVSTWSGRASDAQKALQAWNNAQRGAMGGLVQGSGSTDKVPTLLAPGEGVLNHRRMDQILDMAMGRGGGGGSYTINVVVEDRTFAGMSRDARRRVAEQIRPELDRLISIRA